MTKKIVLIEYFKWSFKSSNEQKNGSNEQKNSSYEQK